METNSGGNVSGSKYSSVKYYIPPESNVTPNQDGELCGAEQAGLGTDTKHRSGGVATQYIPKSGERLNFQIPRKNKEKRALFQYVSSESREFEDILTILSSSYRDSISNGAYTYTKLRLIHSEQLEKDFVEKRKELKQDGRTEKELEETHCFLLSDHLKLPWICEKGLSVGHSWITSLGNPAKGVYLSKYSDLLQINPFNPGVMGEIIIFKVIKGKVKSIYDNMSKNLLDPTPKFDCHFSKNASKVTSIASYRAFELTQQYFYEYDFDELRVRPRHVCPYAVVSFQFKSKDALLKAKPMAPLRSNSQTPDGSTGRSKYTVWSGELVNDGNAVCRVSFCSFSPPFLPFRLPENLELHLVMRMDQVTHLIPSALFSSNLYAGSHEVMKNGMYCNLLEVVDNSKSGDVLTALIQSLEDQRLVLVHMLTDKGVLFLLSSGQMATQSERSNGWKNCLQALFVFQESRDVAKYSTKCPASHDPFPSSSSHDAIMPQLNSFVPALHHALVKVRCNPPADILAGVENQARDYLSGLHDGKLRHIPITEYDAKLDDRGKLFPAPKHPKLNIEGYLRSYIYSPKLYAMPVARANELVERYCVVPEDDSPVMAWEGIGGSSRELALEVKPTGITTAQLPAVKMNLPPQSLVDTNMQKMKQLINILQAYHTKAEADVRRKGEAHGVLGLASHGLKRKLETVNRTLKYVKKTSWERGREDCRTAEEVDQSPLCLSSVLQSVGLRAVDLSTDRSETAVKLLKMLNSLKNAEAKQSGGSREGTEQTDGPLIDRMIQLGLPVNQDIDLRKINFGGLQDKAEVLEEQTTGSISSLEGFSPSSNSEAPKRSQSQPQGVEDMPWVLIPITGLKSQKYCQRKKDNPQDPRFIPQVPMAISSYSLSIPERRERSITPTLEETPELSPPSPPLDEPEQPSPTPSPYPSPYSSPYPSPYPSPCSSHMEEEEEHLPETPCDATELAGNDKASTNQNHFQIPVGLEGTALPGRSSSSMPPEEPSPTFPTGARKQAASSTLAEDSSTMDDGQLEGEEEVKGETVKDEKNEEMEEDVEPEASIEDEEPESEDLEYTHVVNDVEEDKRMEVVADDEEELDGLEMIKDEKQEQQLEEDELEPEEEEDKHVEEEDKKEKLQKKDLVSLLSPDQIPPEQTMDQNPPPFQNFLPKQNILYLRNGPPIWNAPPIINVPPTQKVSPIQNVPPLARDVPPLAQDVPPLARDVPPLTRDVPPLARDVPPLARDVPPLARDVPPLARDVPPLARDVPPLARDVPPLARDGPPLARDGPPLARDGPPLARDGPPLARNIPLTQTVFPDQNAHPVYRPAVSGMDCILDQQFSNFSTELQILLLRESVQYSMPHPPSQYTPRQPSLQPFSEYVSFYNSSPPMQAYVSSLRDRMCTVIDTQEDWIPAVVTGDPPQGSGDIHHHRAYQAPTTTYNWNHYLGPDFQSYPNNLSFSPFIPDGSNSYSSQAASQFPSAVSQGNSGSKTVIMPSLGFPVPGTAYCHASPLYNDPTQTRLPLPQVSSSGAPLPVHPRLTDTDLESVDWTATLNKADLDDHGLQETYPPHTGGLFDSKDSKVIGESSVSVANAKAWPQFRPVVDSLSMPMEDSVPGSEQAPPEDISSLISKLKPELFTNLVEIIKDVRRNAAQFYIHTQDSDWEFSHYIKEYLQRMGNIERSPVSFLEKETRNDKLMVLIQNKDIAAHVHKIPALVQLKRQPSVIFAGVDSLDDVKNHTYNELFVSGGFVVSDELVLNPDYITHERLRVILTFLDQQNSAESLWRWRVHCKTQKKLKEQSRFKCEAMKILNLLTMYQKKNIVEFLPYHECDAPSRTAPDLDCLMKLQAQHIQQRHIIFLTERHHEMSHYSSNGIVIANVNDIMHNFGSLVGFHDIRDKRSTSEDLLAAATTEQEDKRVLKEPILLASPSSPDNLVDRLSTPLNEEDFQEPFPDQLVPETPISIEGLPAPAAVTLNFQALSEAISQFKADKAARSQMEALEVERPDSPPGPKIPGLGTDSPVRPVVGASNPDISYLTPAPLLGPPHSGAGTQRDVDLSHKRQTLTSTLTSIHSELGVSTANEGISSQEEPNAFSRSPCLAADEGQGDLTDTPGNTNEHLSPNLPRAQGEENTKPSSVGVTFQGGMGKTSSHLRCPNPGSSGLMVAAPQPGSGENASADRLAQTVRLQHGNGLLPRPNLTLGNHNLAMFQRSLMNGLGGPRGSQPLISSPIVPRIGMGLGQATGPGSCLWFLQPQNMWLGGNNFSPRMMGNTNQPWGANQTANQVRGNRPWNR
ncbi:hypothetical protein UPYG_G00176120 [Umbra pygmaea]|uniref:DUF3715 domain-containing protein n=1 Tax=Umbra pygmaea TaxID=75934 RepID=A0ABD0WUK1_UMBPY